MKTLRRIADGALSCWEDDKADELLARGGFELAVEAPAKAPVVEAAHEPVETVPEAVEAPGEESKPAKKSKKGA